MKLIKKLKEWKAMTAEEIAQKVKSGGKRVSVAFFNAAWPAWLLGLVVATDPPTAMPPPPQVKSYLEARMAYTSDVPCEEICMDMCANLCQSIYQENQKKDAEKKIRLEQVVAEQFDRLVDNDAKVMLQESIVKRINKYDKLFAKYAEMYGISDHKNTLKAIAYVESKGRHWGLVTKRLSNGKTYTRYAAGEVTTGADGEKGMMQIMHGTAKQLGINPLNIYQNMMGAAKLLSLLLEKYDGDVALALYAYNAGQRTVDSRINEKGSAEEVVHGAIAKEKVNEYPIKVLAAKQLFDWYDEYLKGKNKILIKME